MAEFSLATDRLVLRDWRDADWAPFFQCTNTAAVMRWLGGVVDENRQIAVRERLESYSRDFGFTFWVAQRNDDGGHLAGDILGFCGLKRCNQPGGPLGDVEIGWRLREDAWGRGYAREAAVAARDAAFGTFDAPHIIALTVEENTASWGLMRAIGMARCETLDFDCTDFGTDRVIAYALERSQWEAKI